MWLWVLVFVVAIITGYALFGRAWLKNQPWAQGFFAAIEPLEIWLWSKSETILWARLKMFVGILLTVLTQAGQIDLTPLMPFVPDEWEPMVKLAFNMLPLAITVVGMVDEKLRRETKTPLPIVALPDAVAAKIPEVVKAEEAKVEAVAAVAEAKAEGAV